MDFRMIFQVILPGILVYFAVNFSEKKMDLFACKLFKSFGLAVYLFECLGRIVRVRRIQIGQFDIFMQIVFGVQELPLDGAIYLSRSFKFKSMTMDKYFQILDFGGSVTGVTEIDKILLSRHTISRLQNEIPAQPARH